ncbi:PAQR family membrane homeostasis protein TrhA [Rhodovulum sp. DZ06]|uniref:PAQR family membrane homeostasis protein TrhA n=1 Tax=Rhodovulum sp. DZ06 TaxID=3425126 RepID=UPI003D337CFC
MDDRAISPERAPSAAVPLEATPAPRPLTRAEIAADAAVHAAGLVLALMGIPVMIVLAALLHGEGALIAAVSVYGAAMLAMFGCSAAYNLCPETRERARAVLRRFDHAAIYLKIAGCQTPFAVLVGGAWSGWALGAVWAGALGGAAAKLIAPHRLQRLSLLFYIALGWAGLALFFPGAGAEPLAAATAILALVGGLTYTAGIGFFLWERLPFHNAIWHGFVVVATFTFYSAVITEVSLRAS